MIRCTCGHASFAERRDVTTRSVTRWVRIPVQLSAGAGVVPAGLSVAEDVLGWASFTAALSSGTRAVFCRSCKRVRSMSPLSGIVAAGCYVDGATLNVVVSDAAKPVSGHEILLTQGLSHFELPLALTALVAPALVLPLVAQSPDGSATYATTVLQAALPSGLSGDYSAVLWDRGTDSKQALGTVALST